MRECNLETQIVWHSYLECLWWLVQLFLLGCSIQKRPNPASKLLIKPFMLLFTPQKCALSLPEKIYWSPLSHFPSTIVIEIVDIFFLERKMESNKRRSLCQTWSFITLNPDILIIPQHPSISLRPPYSLGKWIVTVADKWGPLIFKFISQIRHLALLTCYESLLSFLFCKMTLIVTLCTS